MGWTGWTSVGTDTKRKLYQKKNVIENYIEDAKQDEKHVPDLLESIIQVPGLVKEELRHFFRNDTNYVESYKHEGFNFLDSANPKFSRRRPLPAFLPVGFKQ